MIYAISDPVVLPYAVEDYKNFGLVVCRLFDEKTCKSRVLEQIEEIVLAQPWTPKSIIDAYAENKKKFVDSMMAPIDKKNTKAFPSLKVLEDAWPLHRGFGACCDPAAFHLPGVWEVRQDPLLYKLASALTGTDDLWVDVNRSIQKLPGQGEEEFLHWDLNPFACVDVDDQAICGKVVYTDASFFYSPGTHTAAFNAEFRRLYAEHYTVPAGAAKFAIDPAKPDPLSLCAKAERIVVPAGCAVFWHPRLLHGVIKNTSNKIQWGMYVGFFKAGSRRRYEETCGIDEREDRIASYREGRAPKLWPSFDPIQFYPKRFRNFPRILQGYIDKMPKDHPSITTRTTKQGKVVPHLLPWPVTGYVPPALSSLGRRLLGLDSWHGESNSEGQEVCVDPEDQDTEESRPAKRSRPS
jgi:hypothetical protein